MTAQHFTRDLLPSRPEHWQKFTKVIPTRMVRIDGPFVVETNEGPLFCPDGWLALDARGFPYPIDDAEHQLIYKPLEAEHNVSST